MWGYVADWGCTLYMYKFILYASNFTKYECKQRWRNQCKMTVNVPIRRKELYTSTLHTYFWPQNRVCELFLTWKQKSHSEGVVALMMGYEILNLILSCRYMTDYIRMLCQNRLHVIKWHTTSGPKCQICSKF